MQELGKLGPNFKTIAVSNENYQALCNLSRHESFNNVVGRLVKSASRRDK
jgi:predicted CopG family antitoxin